MNELASEVAAVAGKDPVDREIEPRPGDVLRLYAESARPGGARLSADRVHPRRAVALRDWYLAQDKIPEELLETRSSETGSGEDASHG